MDQALISAGFTSLKAAGEIAKALIGAKIDYSVKEQVLAIQQSMIDAQQSMLSMQDALREAKEKQGRAEKALMEYQDWSSEKQRYQLFQPYPGCMVYALKEAEAGGEIAHYLCTTCYEKRQKSILSDIPMKGAGVGWFALVCGTCKDERPTGYRSADAPQFVSR